MAKLIYLAIASLDGYVADADGNFDWAVPDEEVHAFINDLDRPVGTYLYGRRMYETMVGWETEHTLADQSLLMRGLVERGRPPLRRLRAHLPRRLGRRGRRGDLREEPLVPGVSGLDHLPAHGAAHLRSADHAGDRVRLFGGIVLPVPRPYATLPPELPPRGPRVPQPHPHQRRPCGRGAALYRRRGAGSAERTQWSR